MGLILKLSLIARIAAFHTRLLHENRHYKLKKPNELYLKDEANQKGKKVYCVQAYAMY